MIPNEAKNVLQDILAIEMFEMHRALDNTLNATMARLASTGTLQSGRALFLLAQDGTNSLKSRGWYILGQLLRTLAAYKTSMTPDVVADASKLMSEWIDREAQMITSLVFNKPNFAHPASQAVNKELRAQFAQEVQRLMSRLSSEIKLSAATAQTGSQPTAQSLTFNAPIGLVQVGDGNQVNIHQHLDASIRSEISVALEQLIRRIDQSDVNTGIYPELRQLAEEAKAEAENPEGNTLKLGTILRGVADTTKVIGTLNESYQTLKPLLSQLGIHLP